MNILLLIIVILLIGVIVYNCNTREGYASPLYINRSKYVYDNYPRTNGSIYGFGVNDGGSWTLFSGYPSYGAY